MLNLSSLASSSPTGRLTIQNPNKQGLHGHHFLLSETSIFKNYSSVSLPNSYKKNLSLKCRHSDHFEPHQQQQQKFSPNDSSFSSQLGRLFPLVQQYCFFYPFLGEILRPALKDLNFLNGFLKDRCLIGSSFASILFYVNWLFPFFGFLLDGFFKQKDLAFLNYECQTCHVYMLFDSKFN